MKCNHTGRPSGRRVLVGPIMAPRLLLAAAAVAALAARADADSSTWSTTPTDSNWANAANWLNGVVPGSTTSTTNTDTATFGASSILAVTVDAGRNLQNLTFTGPTGGTTTYAYAVSGSPLLLTTGGLLVAVGANAGSTVVSAPLAVQSGGGTGAYAIESDLPGSSRLLTISGAVSGTSAAGSTTTVTLQGTSGAQNLLSGVVGNGTAGAVALVKNGTGTWVVSNTNTYTGGTTINAGTLTTGVAGTTTPFGAGAITLNGGTLRLSATSSTFNSPLVLGTAGGTLSTKGSAFQPTAITGTGPLTIGIDSAAVFTPATFQNYAGPINVNANSLSVTFRLGTSLTNFDPTSLQNAPLTLGAGVTMNRGFGTNGAQTVTVGSLAGAAGSFLTGGSGAGTGTFTYAVGGNGGSTTFAGAISDGSTKTALAKTGAGTLTLTGTNTYTAGTTLTAGTIQANTATSSLGTGTATVNGGVLAGTGQTGGAVVINTGGTVTGGGGAGPADAVGNLSTGAQTWNAGGAFVAKIDAANANTDRLVMSGLTVNATATTPFTVNLQGTNLAAIADGSTYVLAVDTGATFATTPDPFTVASLSLVVNGAAAPATYSLSEIADRTNAGGVDLLLSVTAAPEPTSLLLAASAVAPLALGRRRRRVG